MALYAKKAVRKEFELCPEGVIDAQLVEVRDQGMVSGFYGAKPKLLFILANQPDQQGW